MRLRRPLTFLLIAATAMAGLCGLPTPGGAAPLDASPLAGARAEAALVEAQLEAQGQRVSELDERYNQARLAAGRADAELGRAKAELGASDDRLTRARAQLSRQATHAYIHGGAGPALDQLVRTRGPDLAVRGRYLETALDAADRALDAVETARRNLSRRSAALARARDTNQAAASRLAADRDAAAAAASGQEATLARVRREVTRLLAQDAARLASEAARRVRASAASSARRPATGSGTAPMAPRSPVGRPQPPSDGAAVAVAEAVRQLGKPYEWAGAGPDTFDCSGLTMWAWRAAGVRLSHSAEYQFRETRRVDLNDLRPGDLLFFGAPIHHMGMYVGDDTMIEAPHTGALVRYRNSWRSDLVGAGRP